MADARNSGHSGVKFAILLFILTLLLMEAVSRPATTTRLESILDVVTASNLEDLLAAGDGQEDVDVLEEQVNNGTEEETTTERARTGLRVCIRLRVLRLLFRLFMLRASGFNSQQLARLSSSSVTKATPTQSAELMVEQTDTDMDELCRVLCGLGMCPPGCPTDHNPPWGKRR